MTTIEERIEDILNLAIEKFRSSRIKHANNTIDIGIFYNPSEGEWQTWIQKPTKNQLKKEEIWLDEQGSVKEFETECHFYSFGETLPVSLENLFKALKNAKFIPNKWEPVIGKE